MRKRRQTEAGAEATSSRWSPPRGITLVSFPQRPKRPYGVQWRLEGKRKTKTFPTVEKQVNFAKALAADVKQNGVAAYRLDEDEAREWRAFRATIGPDADLDAVAQCWERHKPLSTAPLTLEKAVEEYKTAKKLEGVSADTIGHFKAIFDRFGEIIGDKNVGAVTSEDVTAFMIAQEGEPSNTRDTRFRRVRALFNWLLASRRISYSPFEGVKPPKVEDKEVQILTLKQTQILFEQNTKTAEGEELSAERREVVGRLALEAFVGLRTDTAAQIVAGEIHADGLRIPAAKIKTKKNQFLDGLPENVMPWLKWSNPENWTMDVRQYERAKGEAFVRADIPHPRNCLRHGFASYHVAAFKDPGRTSLILCHRSPRMLWDKYKGIATQPDGLAYFKIMPPVEKGST